MAESPAARWRSRLLRTRWMVRAPVALYRMRLGRVFGSRMLMLERCGRSTGRRRHVVLEVVDHPAPAPWVIGAGFGDKAQWLRNVRVDPRTPVWVATRHAVPAIRVSAAERAVALRSYAARHPRMWRRLRPVLEETLGVPIDADGTNLPTVALEGAGR